MTRDKELSYLPRLFPDGIFVGISSPYVTIKKKRTMKGRKKYFSFSLTYSQCPSQERDLHRFFDLSVNKSLRYKSACCPIIFIPHGRGLINELRTIFATALRAWTRIFLEGQAIRKKRWMDGPLVNFACSTLFSLLNCYFFLKLFCCGLNIMNEFDWYLDRTKTIQRL